MRKVKKFCVDMFGAVFMALLSSVVILGAIIWAVYSYRSELKSLIMSILGL